ncbi:cupin domain-containing protein [Dapis sp. BLCC M126]|uniref:cupin domain-containing protein n=1 Tax=Dapis sp. BLCC M126 TaxID=3400189 RepID=UPI003CEC8404
MNKQDIIEQLSLVKHIEGGYFKETYRSDITVNTDRKGSERKLLTSIYYLLTDDSPVDYFHKNKSDIIHYFHIGYPITYLIVDLQGKLSRFKLGFDVSRGHVLQLLVPKNCWKAAILEEGEFGLLGEAVAPGFEYIDMELAQPDSFKASFPNLWDELSPYVKH